MKTCLLWIALCVMLLAGCGSSPQNLIVGKWEVQNAPSKMTAEFRADGTSSLTILGQTLAGTYKLNGEELEWSMNGRSTKAKAKVTATDLELTDDANHTIVYKRQ